ncbi:putative glycosyl hydrolase 18 family protein [Lyophyllum shimeji]|uniref:Glycosyl hydrolase 18 family protein n=1 Tax=Lyophyllum shimeji TaxID=47721 RepID=A0A9P3PUI5_LYOSH|nr:putative glycosyl hydrolase 18 family protein [Lyophyllum shimeji]
MVFLRLTYAVAAVAGLAGLSSVFAAPSTATHRRDDGGAPHFVAYGDKSGGQTGPPTPDKIQGFNVFALAFLLTSGPADKAQEWTQMSDGDRANIKKQYNDAGIKLIVSAFGSTDAPTTQNTDPVATANKMAGFVKQYNLDGIDVDYEDFDAMQAGKAEDWLSTFTSTLRDQLPKGQYIITHAPVAPWFSPGKYPNGAYLKVNQNVGDAIDWYNIQFYNQGQSEYADCNGLLNQSSDQWPKTSVFEIAGSGVPMNKLVIGKPAGNGEANNGIMAPGDLANCVQQAKSKGWNAGVMVWQYPTAGSDWIKTVRGGAFP